MQLRIIPINIDEKKVYENLFPPKGDYVEWIRSNNPGLPEFDINNVKLHLFHLEEDEFPARALIIPRSEEPIVKSNFKAKDGFGNYSTVYLEVDMDILLEHSLSEISIVRSERSSKNPSIHFSNELNQDTLIQHWIEAGMPEPWIY